MSNITRKEWQDKQYALIKDVIMPSAIATLDYHNVADASLQISSKVMEGIYGECPEDNE